MPVQVAVVNTFWQSFMRQPGPVQQRIQAFLSDFIQHGCSYPSFKYKAMMGDVDPRIREARIDGSYRAILLHPRGGAPFCVLWVDKHDRALAWPKKKRFERDVHGAIHILDAQTHVDDTASSASDHKGLFDAYSQEDLMEAGISRFMIPAVRALRKAEELEIFCRDLQTSVADILQTLWANDRLDQARAHLGVSVVHAARMVEDADDISHVVELLKKLSPAQVEELLQEEFLSGVVRMLPRGATPRPAAASRTRRLERLVLDRAQQAFAQSLANGPRLLRGVAGSGKTLLIASLAMFKAIQGLPRILITCYNLALTRYIGSLLDVNLTNPRHRERIEVRSMFQLCGDLLLDGDVKHEGEKTPYYDELVRRALAAAGQRDPMYDAVLVDEAQDLSVDMLQLLVACAKGDPPNITFAEDANQNLFRRRPSSFSWSSSIGHSMRGRTTILRISHRSTSQICEAADALAGAPLSHTIEDEHGQLVLVQRDDRNGPDVEHRAFASPSELSSYVVQTVRALLAGGVPAAEIAVLYTRVLKEGEAGLPVECLELIDQGIGCDRVRLVASAIEKLELDLTEDRVKIGSVYAFKGLDFEAVILLDTVSPEARNRVLLFVGATRARDRLHVVTLAPAT